MSPAPKYRARRGNTEAERKGVEGARIGFDAVPLFHGVAKRMEGTGMSIEADRRRKRVGIEFHESNGGAIEYNDGVGG